MSVYRRVGSAGIAVAWRDQYVQAGVAAPLEALPVFLRS